MLCKTIEWYTFYIPTNQPFQKYQIFPLYNENLHSAILDNQSPMIGFKS